MKWYGWLSVIGIGGIITSLSNEPSTERTTALGLCLCLLFVGSFMDTFYYIKEKRKKKVKTAVGNPCGIIGVCIGWAIPIVGIILGIIALIRKEKNFLLAILSIYESIIFWIIWVAFFS
jgi:heme O synthase-like polyprenyltransferase